MVFEETLAYPRPSASNRTQFDGVHWQRCWTHLMWAATGKVSHQRKAALVQELKAAWNQSELKLALAEADRVAARWEKQYHKVAKQIRDLFEETMSMHDLPREHRRKIYTSNMIERVMAEVKRRTRVVGIFPNESAADRFIGAHLLERQEACRCERTRYLVMTHLERERVHEVRARRKDKPSPELVQFLPSSGGGEELTEQPNILEFTKTLLQRLFDTSIPNAKRSLLFPAKRTACCTLELESKPCTLTP